MSFDRRYFIKSFGVTLGSLITSGSLSGCKVITEQKDSTAKDTPITKSTTSEKVRTPSSASPKKLTPSDSELKPLRLCWLDLSTLERDIIEATSKARQEKRDSWWEMQEVVKKERATKHQAILDTLVGEGKLDKLVAEQIQVAFEEALYHIARSMATCYMGLPNEYYVRSDLLKQAEVLSEISGGLDPATVAQARAAIAQDMTYFEMIANSNGNKRSLWESYNAGNLKAGQIALEAARLLTELLLPETSD